MSIVKRVLALLKMEVRELMREANMTDSIRPRSPERKGGSEWYMENLSSFVLGKCEDLESVLPSYTTPYSLIYLSRKIRTLRNGL